MRYCPFRQAVCCPVNSHHLIVSNLRDAAEAETNPNRPVMSDFDGQYDDRWELRIFCRWLKNRESQSVKLIETAVRTQPKHAVVVLVNDANNAGRAVPCGPARMLQLVQPKILTLNHTDRQQGDQRQKTGKEEA